MRRIRLHPEVRADIKDIRRFTTGRWDEEQADKFIEDIDKTIRHLAQADKPLRSERECDDLWPGLIKHKHSSYMIYFVRTETTFRVIAILHESRLPELHLLSRR